MSRNSTITIPMIPSGSHFQLPTGKRKADDSNPLLAASKRAKKDNSGASNKRRLLNAEETSTGLLIVRAPPSSTQDSFHSSSQPIPSSSRVPSSLRPSSQPLSQTSSTTHTSSSSLDPPSKKFRPSSQPPNNSASVTPYNVFVEHSPIPEDPELENAVRAMNDEADHLRRQTRAPTLMDQNVDPAFHFAIHNEATTNGSRKGKSRIIIRDTSLPIAQNETPQIERNKRLREGAMTAIMDDGEQDGRPGRGEHVRRPNHRRRSSLSRGKRISSSFELTGIITSPHNSVSEASFYKHIDCDLPESERLRQLLIWCTIRASGTTTFSSSSTPSKPKVTLPSSSKAPLPPLSASAAQTLREVQDDIVRLLAERKIDLSLYGPESAKTSQQLEGSTPLRENEQNRKNKGFEIKYSEEIRRLEEEEDQWKRVTYHYESYVKKANAATEKRVSALSNLSSKAKGKQRDVDDYSAMFPDSQDLPPHLRASLDMAKHALQYNSLQSSAGTVVSSSTRFLTTRRGTKVTSDELETMIANLLPDVRYKLDYLHSSVNSARTTARIVERMLDQRFKLLSDNLDARHRLDPPGTSPADSKHSAEVLRSYIDREAKQFASSGSGTSAGSNNVIELMRALSRIDTMRPQSMIGDSVRRAAREIRRIGENGVGGVGDRRLTAVYSSGSTGGAGTVMTPRKVPGTPRRGTPGRERTPGR